jgi:hypothetical protein
MNRLFRVLEDLALTVATPLLMGGLIYYWTRQHSIHFLSWFDQQLNLRPVARLHLPTWMTFHLPDGLWTFSFSSLLLIVWQRRIDNESILWLSLPLVTAIVLEITFGTFDFQDLWFILGGGLLPFVAHPKNQFLLTQKIKIK